MREKEATKKDFKYFIIILSNVKIDVSLLETNQCDVFYLNFKTQTNWIPNNNYKVVH